MEFKQFRYKLQGQFDRMTEGTATLFVVEVDKDMLWDTYLNSFPEEANPVFRKRRTHDCSCCRHFIRAVGNVVTIKDNKIVTMWDFKTGDSAYQAVVDAMSSFIKQHPITDVFVTKVGVFGTSANFEKTDSGVITWDHLFVNVPARFMASTSKTEGTLTGLYRDARNVFKRSLTEITEDAVVTVLDLISQGSLYKGDEWEEPLKAFLKLHKQYHKLPNDDRDNYCWITSREAGEFMSKIRNHSIGTLLTNISDGMDLDVAVKKYEAIVAPTNYKRPKAIFTKRMLEDAQKTLEELGLMNSLGRRYATLSDITVNNIIFANRDVAGRIKGGSVFDDLKQDVAVNPKNLSKIEEVPIDVFIRDVLPNITSIELLLENKHAGNMVSLIAPAMDGKTMFKWGNNFSWAYRGNITDSMKELVKAAGGNIEGVLRFSIVWNDAEFNPNDFDAHCVEPNGNHIFYPNKTRIHPSSGVLDVDIISPLRGVPAVENISYSDLRRMPEGIYDFAVHCYNNRGGRTGFSAEIEFDGQIFSFNYDKELRQNETVRVAKVKYYRISGFELKECIPHAASSRDLWGIKTQQFYPVSVLMYSPNYWDEQDGIGHKHYFFMLNGCKNTDSPNGFFNEFLREDLMAHKRVFEALGSKMRVADSDDQLSGVGFSSTQRNSVVCKVEGHFTRMIRITF